MNSKTQKHCVFDDIPWEVKLIIFEYVQDRLVISHVNKEWRNLVWKYGKKEDEFVRKYINQLACEGHLDLLKWLSTQIDITDYWDKLTCDNTAGGGHLEVLKWLRDPSVHKTDRGVCPWDEWTCVCAAWNGHLDVLKWLHANGCPWDEQTCAYAAWGGHLDMLKWLRDPDEHSSPEKDGFSEICPWDKWACTYAAWRGQLDVLRWLRENGCPE